jgi:hypothetical protein
VQSGRSKRKTAGPEWSANHTDGGAGISSDGSRPLAVNPREDATGPGKASGRPVLDHVDRAASEVDKRIAGPRRVSPEIGITGMSEDAIGKIRAAVEELTFPLALIVALPVHGYPPDAASPLRGVSQAEIRPKPVPCVYLRAHYAELSLGHSVCGRLWPSRRLRGRPLIGVVCRWWRRRHTRCIANPVLVRPPTGIIDGYSICIYRAGPTPLRGGAPPEH